MTDDKLDNLDAIQSEFNFDESVNIESNSVLSKLSLRIDIILHASYLVPCPYISICDNAGNFISLEDFNNYFQLIYGFIFCDLTHFILDEHPVSGLPCYTLHICGIQEYMEIISQQENNDHVDKLYLLKWFSIVGMKFSMPISPIFYKEASNMLLL